MYVWELYSLSFGSFLYPVNFCRRSRCSPPNFFCVFDRYKIVLVDGIAWERPWLVQFSWQEENRSMLDFRLMLRYKCEPSLFCDVTKRTLLYTFRDNLSLPSSRFKQSKKVGSIGCPGTSVTEYRTTLGSIPSRAQISKPKWLEKKPVSVPLCPSQVQHGRAWDRIGASAVRGRSLNSVVSWSKLFYSNYNSDCIVCVYIYIYIYICVCVCVCVFIYTTTAL